MKPPGFRRDVRPVEDLQALWWVFSDAPHLILPLVLFPPAVAVGGLAELSAGNAWGLLITVGALCVWVAFAWIGYYRFEERPEPSGPGRHTA